MEQLKQLLQLQNDGVGIREMARRIGISRNSVRKYLSLLNSDKALSDQELADRAYSNDMLQHDAERLEQLLSKTEAIWPSISVMLGQPFRESMGQI